MFIKKLLTYFLGWRLLLIIVAIIAVDLIPFKSLTFPYRDVVLEPYSFEALHAWGNFDGVHYLGIADDGYWANFTQAFFPLYPSLMGVLVTIGIPGLYAGLIISHVAFVGFLYYLYELIKLDYSKKAAWKTVLLYLVFPTSFYFGSVYTESVFMLLVVSSLYAMRTKHEKEAIILAAFASATRIIGIFLLPALLYEKYKRNKEKITRKNILSYLPFLGAATGLIAYMSYLQIKFNDALYFLHAQPAFGADRSSDKLILLYQVVYRYLKMFATVKWNSLLFFSISQEFWYSMVFLFLLGWAWYKKVRISYLIFAGLSFILPTLTGTFSSMPRYVLVLFPAFIITALTVKGKWWKALLAFLTILLIINTLLFTRGYWVA